MNRRATALLTIASIAVSAALLTTVDRVRTDTQTSFANTISGTDLIIGARSGDLNLLLYTVFRIGNPTNNISWESYEEIGNRPEVAWTIPISLGDAHRGYRVLGTDLNYFEHYQFAKRASLEFSKGVRSRSRQMRSSALKSPSSSATRLASKSSFRTALRKPVS